MRLSVRVVAVLLLSACSRPMELPLAPEPVKPGEVAGRVLVDGAPAVRAQVELPFAGLVAASDAEGRFALGRVPEGSQRLLVTYWREDGVLAARQDGVAVFAGRTTELGEIQLQPTGTVRGRLQTGHATGNAGGLVFVPLTDRVTLTGDDGRFELKDVPPGEVVLEVRLAGYAASRTTVTVPAGGDADAGEVALAPSETTRRGTVRGRVQPQSSDVVVIPPGGTAVVMESVNANATFAGTTDEVGEFEFAGVPEGVYSLRASRDGFGEMRLPNVAVDAEAPVELPALAIRPADAPDLDGDGLADESDPDVDGDGYCATATDSCPADAFPRDASEWLDGDADGIGDRADPDDDEDGLSDLEELSAGRDGWTTNPRAADSDGDTVRDPVDVFPADAAESTDLDADRVGDNADNCVDKVNPQQEDANGNGVGDACEGAAENRAPVLTISGPVSAEEGESIELALAATDPDGERVSLVLREGPSGAVFVDAGEAARITWTPAFDQAGSHVFEVAATDGRATLVKEHAIAVFDKATADLPPSLELAGRRSWSEGELVTLSLRATDTENRPITLELRAGPADATFTDYADGTALFTLLAPFDSAGEHALSFAAKNGSTEKVVDVVIAIDDVNRAPRLQAPSRLTAFAGQPLPVAIAALDPDGDPLTYSLVDAPAGASIEGATITYLAPAAAIGTEVTLLVRASDGTATVEATVRIGVVEPPNHAPVLATSGALSVAEGDAFALAVLASDADTGDTLTLSARGLPLGATFAEEGPGRAVLAFTPSFTQAGSYPISFVATDGRATVVLDRTLVVTNTPVAPTVAVSGSRAAREGEPVILSVRATEPDGGAIVLSTKVAPANATFVDYGDGSGLFTWLTGYEDAGSPVVQFAAKSGALETLARETLTIANTNRAPQVTAPARLTATLGQDLVFEVTATDPDGGAVTLSLVSPPVGAALANGKVTYRAAAGTVGTDVLVRVRATDGTAETLHDVTVSVVPAPNRAPSLNATGGNTIAEGAALAVQVAATDPDGDSVLLFARGVPANATFTDKGGGRGELSFAPDLAQAGTYELTFVATDGKATATLGHVIVVTDTPGNAPPVLTVGGRTSVNEGEAADFNLFATDAEGDAIALAVTGRPAGATFVDRGDGTGVFRWLTTHADAGSVALTFTATSAGRSTSRPITLTVANVNRAPDLAPVGARSISAGTRLDVTVGATDADGDTLSFSFLPSLTGASIVDNGDGTAKFSYTPPPSEQGRTIAFDVTVSDGSNAATRTLSVSVLAPTNVAPVWSAVADQALAENTSLSLDVAATDPNGTTPALVATSLPMGATFTDDGDGTGVVTFVANYEMARRSVNAGKADFNVVLEARDGSLASSKTIKFTVTNVNRPPTLLAQSDVTIGSGGVADVQLFPSDPDPDETYTFEWLVSPATLAFTATGAKISLKPSESQTPTSFDVTGTVRDASGATASNAFKLHVEEPHFVRITNTGPDVARSVFFYDPPRKQVVAVNVWREPTRLWKLDFTNATKPTDLAWTSVILPSGPPAGIEHVATYDPVRGRVILVRIDGTIGNRQVWVLNLATEQWELFMSSNPFAAQQPLNISFFAFDGEGDRLLWQIGGNYGAAWVPGSTLSGGSGFAPNQWGPNLAAWTSTSTPTVRRAWNLYPQGNPYCGVPTVLREWQLGPTPALNTDVVAPGAPPYREGLALHADPQRDRLLLYGGTGYASNNCAVAADPDAPMYSYDLTAKKWQPMRPNRMPPPGRLSASMAIVPEKNWLVISGGCSQHSSGSTWYTKCLGVTHGDTWIGDLSKF